LIIFSTDEKVMCKGDRQGKVFDPEEKGGKGWRLDLAKVFHRKFWISENELAQSVP
jgi:hypothetical protein